MQKNNYYIFLIISWLINIGNVQGQPFVDSVYSENIHTVQLYKEGWELSYPVIVLNSAEKLKLSFDDFNNKIQNYFYSIVQCNSDWEPVNLSFPEYAYGFEQNHFTNYSFSTNTLIKFIHYSLVFPNENCTPKISGNYILKVFRDFDENNIVFTRKFYVTETSASLDIQILQPEVPRYMKKYQQFKITLKPGVSDYTDLRNEIKTVIVQNNQPDRSKICLISRLTDENILVYDDQDSNLFEGGNEFRNFDIKSIKYQSQHIKSIVNKESNYEIILHPDSWRTKSLYFFDSDLNGNYFIQNSVGTNKDIDADYVTVLLSLPTKEPLVDGNLYIYGALTDWKCNNASLLIYNYELQTYEITLLLKQGYYNYQYAYKPNDTKKIDLSYVEGTHFESENDYLVYVYFRPFASRFERLIGFKLANSIKKGN